MHCRTAHFLPKETALVSFAAKVQLVATFVLDLALAFLTSLSYVLTSSC